VATIVEYSAEKNPLNAYPTRIISPPVPSQCCGAHTVRVGEIQDDRGWPFVYQRCAVCGFTVRRLAPREELLEAIRTWRYAESTSTRRDAA
jgi:hypothetical protein